MPPLPVPVADPIGRDDAIARILRWFVDGARIVTLTGQPGTGKTRLALHVAYAVQHATGWPARYLPFAALSSASLIHGSIAHALSIGEDDQPLLDKLTRRLNGLGPLLLLLDNLEHLDGAAAEIAPLLEGCPELRILATSRSALNLPGERRFDVLPLAVPRAGASLAELRANPAVQLFVAHATRASFTVTEADLPTVGQICARLEGLPLAIELAAPKAASFGVYDLAQQLQDQEALLTITSPSLDPRHESLRAAIAWSYELLPANVQAALNRLSVFSGGFSQLSAEQLLSRPRTDPEYASNLVSSAWYLEEGEEINRKLLLKPLLIPAESAIQALLDANLIRASVSVNRTVRFDMMESIRAFARERLDASEESGDVRLAHAVVMFAFADAAGHELWTARTRSLFWPLVNEEIGNTRSALAWACDPANGQPTLAALLVVAAWFSFQLAGMASEARTWLEKAISLDEGSERVRLHAMNSLAFSAWTQGDTDRASDVTEFVIRTWKPAYPAEVLGIAQFNAGLVAWQRGDFATMAERLLTAKPTLREAGDQNGEGFCNLALGVLARFGGDQAQAEALLEEAFQLHSSAGHAWGAATARYLAGEAAHDAGDARAAAERILDGLDRYWEQRDVFGSGACVAALAVMAAERNELPRAARLFGAAFAMCEHAGVVLPPVDLERYQAVAAQVGERVSPDVVAAGRSWAPAQAVEEARKLAADIVAGRVPGPVDDPVRTMLTADQLDAVNLLCEGLAVEQIAERLYRDPNTIYDRLARARGRLGVTSNRQLVARVVALRSGTGELHRG